MTASGIFTPPQADTDGLHKIIMILVALIALVFVVDAVMPVNRPPQAAHAPSFCIAPTGGHFEPCANFQQEHEV